MAAAPTKRVLGFTLSVLAATGASPISAIERIEVKIGKLTTDQGQANAISSTLQLKSDDRARLVVRLPRWTPPSGVSEQTGVLSNLRLDCSDLIVREPRFACASLAASAITAKLGAQRLDLKVSYRSDSGLLEMNGSGLKTAGQDMSFDARLDSQGWHAKALLPPLELTALRPLLAPWVQLPAELAISGQLALALNLEQTPTQTRAVVQGQLKALSFQNEAATWIAEKLDAEVSGSLDLAATPARFEMQLTSSNGQFLGGPVLLDFSQQPLTLRASGSLTDEQLLVDAFTLQQRDLSQVKGELALGLSPLRINHADLALEQLQFPAAYTSFLQLLLTDTPFSKLTTRGQMSGRVVLRDALPQQINLVIQDLSLADPAQSLEVQRIQSQLYWRADGTGPPRPSFLAWESSRGWGIEGAQTQLDFVTENRSFRLIQPARLPFFDGALRVDTFSIDAFGRDTMSGRFEALIEPISVAPIAKALGLPEFAGKLSGRIPGLTYEDRVLRLEGNIEADVFDGRIVASNLRVRDPFSQWPRLFADITARGLDLDLITRTFEFGSITGRLDADINGLETFNWSPTAFDFKMTTPPGDRSRRRISQKAVQNLSNIGGGGGGVTAALQSGALRFFDDFGYAQLGISCRLRNDVCQMQGVGDAGDGYYLVRGRGLPRIDIIGNARRVDWPRLLSQLKEALTNTDSIVVN